MTVWCLITDGCLIAVGFFVVKIFLVFEMGVDSLIRPSFVWFIENTYKRPSPFLIFILVVVNYDPICEAAVLLQLVNSIPVLK